MALHITSTTKSVKQLRPTTPVELRSIIETELKRQGPDADLNHIDTSEIEDMSYLFIDLYIKNIKIDQWDVSNVTNMVGMFINCNCFIGTDIGNWDVSNVTNMAHMFDTCSKFTGQSGSSTLTNWNVSNVTNMEYMFYTCSNFNSDLSKWDISNVSDKLYIFVGCPVLIEENKPESLQIKRHQSIDYSVINKHLNTYCSNTKFITTTVVNDIMEDYNKILNEYASTY